MTTRSDVTFDPGPPREVSGHPSGDRWTLVFQQNFEHPPEAVWEALCDPEQLTAWAPFTADRHLGSTGPVTLITIDSDEQQRLPGTVTVADAPRMLAYDWGSQTLRWELHPTESGTELVLQHSIENRDQMSKMAAGWHLCLLSTDALLRGERLGPMVGDAAMNYGWADLQRQYAERLR